MPVALVCNKIDLPGADTGAFDGGDYDLVRVSARHGTGMEDLRAYLKRRMNYEGAREGSFTARRRHLDAIERAAAAVADARRALEGQRAGELMAEDLRQAQMALGEITGAVTADDLLGRIFSSFCIGK